MRFKFIEYDSFNDISEEESVDGKSYKVRRKGLVTHVCILDKEERTEAVYLLSHANTGDEDSPYSGEVHFEVCYVMDDKGKTVDCIRAPTALSIQDEKKSAHKPASN